jgi:hypothetical protein
VEGGLTLTTAAAPKGDIVVAETGSIEFTGAAVPEGDVTVNGALTVSSTGALTIAAGKELAIAGTAKLTDTGSVKLKTSTATTGGAKLTGAGTLTAGDAVITGGSGGWTADLSSAGTAADVTIANVAAGRSGITGGTNVVLTGGTGAVITQKAGTANNVLTLTTVTLDLSTAGSLVLKGATSDPAKVTLTGTAAIIKAGTDVSGTTTLKKIQTIGEKAVEDLTVGTANAGEVAIKVSNAGEKLGTLQGGHTTGPSIIAKTADVTFTKEVVVGGTS